MSNLKLIKKNVLSNRFSITKTYRDYKKRIIIKEFINFDQNHIESHYNWLKKINCPIFSKIIDVYFQRNNIFVALEDVGERDFWSLCKEEWKEKTLKYVYQIIKFLSDFSNEVLSLLPPNNKIIHGDFHMGNIIYTGLSDNFNVENVRLIDLESIQIDSMDKMKTEILLNLFVHPFSFNKPEIQRKILNKIPLSGLTYFEIYKEIAKIDYHFYDYYREFPNFYELHGQLRQYLMSRAVRG